MGEMTPPNDPNRPIPYGQPYQPQPPGYGYPPQVVYVPQPPSSGYANASLILGIIGIFGGWCMFGLPCAIAIACGIVGLNETKNGRRRGRENAWIGLVLGAVVVVPAAVLGIIFLATYRG